MKTITIELKVAVLLTIVMVVVLCGAYPLAVWTAGQALFHNKANGSLITDADGTVRGSALLGQTFSGERYFHPRPSAAGAGFDATSSSGTNFGPTSAKLDASIRERIAAYRATNILSENQPVPADAVTCSASGLDPHISATNAALQIPRIANARGLTLERVAAFVARHTNGRDFNVLGEPGVNVLSLNFELDAAVSVTGVTAHTASR